MPLTKIIFKVSAIIVFCLLFWESRAVEKFIFAVVAVPAYGFGYFVYRNPMRMFEIQKKFYALINWRIEPISLTKEIRNTRGMGVILMVTVLLAAIFLICTGFVSD